MFRSEVHQSVGSQAEENAVSETRGVKLRTAAGLIHTPLAGLLLRLLMCCLLDRFEAGLQLLHSGLFGHLAHEFS